MTNARWAVALSISLSSVAPSGFARADDTTPPTVSVVSPADHDLVGGKISVDANANDDVGVAAVKFYKGAALVATDTTAPYAAEFDFNADPPDAEYELKVVASDAAGNEKSAAVKVRKPKHDFCPPGCTLVDNGAFFKVWAPHAHKVALLGDFNNMDPAQNLLWNNGGWWFAFEPRVTVGQKYYFQIDGGPKKPDPYGRQMEHSAGASIVKDAAAFAWTDGSWRTPRFENMIIYELHGGTFVGKNDGQHYPGNFHNLQTKLDYIKSIGANMIELLPVNEVPGPDGSNPTPYLGYSPTGQFAVEAAYSSGTANSYDDLKAFVNAAHSKGLGVILDVVYNHFSTSDGRDDWYWNFDGDSEGGDGGIYFNNQYTDWGIAPDWNRNEVRQYIEDNCLYWLGEFHFDGLRWDATTRIKDKPGGWNSMRDILWNVRQKYPDRILICENLPYERELVESGNFHSGWWAEFHHSVERAFKAEGGANLGDVKNGVNGGDYSHVSKRVIYAMSHDECRNGSSYLVSEFGGRNNWTSHAKARAAAALAFLSPGIPMLFQGEEFAQDGWFDDNEDHAVNWSYERDADGSRMKALYQDATRLRWDHEAIRQGSLAWTHEDQDNKVLAYRRDWGDDHILVVVNFSGRNFENHSYGVRTGMDGQWSQILCSQDARYGGWDGAGNAFYEPTTQGDGMIYVNIPKFSVVAMRWK